MKILNELRVGGGRCLCTSRVEGKCKENNTCACAALGDNSKNICTQRAHRICWKLLMKILLAGYDIIIDVVSRLFGEANDRICLRSKHRARPSAPAYPSLLVPPRKSRRGCFFSFPYGTPFSVAIRNPLTSTSSAFPFSEQQVSSHSTRVYRVGKI